MVILPDVLLGVDDRPRRRGLGEGLRRVQQVVRPELQRDPVVDAVDRVEPRALQEGAELLPGRDQLDVDRLDRTAVDQAQVGVAGGGHEVVLAATAVCHERDHLARGAGVLRVDGAARLLLERLDPLSLRVALPGDQVELPLAFSDRLLRLHALRRRRQSGAGNACGAPGRGRRTAHPSRQHHRQCECHHKDGPMIPPPEFGHIAHVPSVFCFDNITLRRLERPLQSRSGTTDPDAMPPGRACRAPRARRPRPSSNSGLPRRARRPRRA